MVVGCDVRSENEYDGGLEAFAQEGTVGSVSAKDVRYPCCWTHVSVAYPLCWTQV